MRPRFTLLLLLVSILPGVGCGITGESTMDAMKRRAKALADANKEQAERQKQKSAKAGKAAAAPASEVKIIQPTASPGGKKAASAAADKGSGAKGTDTAKSKSPVSPSGDPSVTRPPLPLKPEPPLTDVQRRNKSAENLDKIITALNKHAREKGTYPTQSIVDNRLGRPLLSWRVAILPYLGLENFYQEFKLNEPWDSPHNLALLPHIPAVYVSPERCDDKTNYLCPYGPGTAFEGIRGKDPLSFADGADMTLVVLEADDAAAVPWTKPQDLAVDDAMRSRLGNLRGEGFLMAFGNGYVAMIHNKVSDGQLSWMLSTDGDDYLSDRTIIYDATVPDVALVTSEKKPEEGAPEAAASDDSKKPGKAGTDAVASSAATSAADRDPRSLPPVKLPTPPKKPERLPLPDEDQLAKARDQLREIYHQEYRESKSKGERQKVAVKMLGDAPRLENDAPAFYEILTTVRDIAVQVGDIATALQAVERLETKFEIPPLELRLQSLDELSGTINESGQSASQLATEAEKVLVSAYEADDYPQALQAHQILVSMLRRGSDRAKIAKMSSYRAAIVEAEKAYKLVPTALSALTTNTENTQANEVAGKYFCLVKEQWELGLPMLARGNDLKLRLLARMDLEKGKTGSEQVQLADHYWDLAQEFKQPQRRSLELRAAFHYAAAMPLLTDGVDLVKAEKRLAETSRIYGKEALAKAGGSTPTLPKPMVNPKDDSG